MNEAPRLAFRPAMAALGRCGATTIRLLARREVHLPKRHVGQRLSFADGSTAVVYRETTVDRSAAADPCVLVVSFRLRWVRGWGFGHQLFRWESLLNTVLFVGFPGFVSKLWVAHDRNGVYRGLYEWDGAAEAEAYVRALWWALIVVSEKDSIRHQVLPGLRRDAVLAGSEVVAAPAREWWNLVGVS
jgi:hypothetical protein